MKKIALLLICMCLSSCSVNRPDHVPIYVNVCKEYGSALEKSERGLTHTNSRVGKNGELYFALEKEGNYTVDEARAILITEVEELLKLFTGTEILCSSLYNFQDVIDSLNFSLCFILKDSCELSGRIVTYVSLYNGYVRYYEGHSLCLNDLKEMHRETLQSARFCIARENLAKKMASGKAK